MPEELPTFDAVHNPPPALDRRAAPPTPPVRHWRDTEDPPGAGKSLTDWLRALPYEFHAVPYSVLIALGGALLAPGVVPRGAGCDPAPDPARELFIHVSAIAFGLIAGLLLLSALAASAQRRFGRPGAPTIVGTALLALVTVAAAAWPHAPTAVPAQILMGVDIAVVVLSYGAALLIPLLAAAIAWGTMRGSRALRATQIAAWITLLVALPLAIGVTYLTVTPICLA